MEYLKKIRSLLDGYEFGCDDIRSKWEGYFMDDLFYSERPVEEIFKSGYEELLIAIKRDMT